MRVLVTGVAGFVGPWVAVALGALLFVPILKTRGHYLALVTIVTSQILQLIGYIKSLAATPGGQAAGSAEGKAAGS